MLEIFTVKQLYKLCKIAVYKGWLGSCKNIIGMLWYVNDGYWYNFL